MNYHLLKIKKNIYIHCHHQSKSKDYLCFTLIYF